MKDEILSKMLEGFLAGLMDGTDVKIEGLKTKTDETVTVEKITITPKGVTALEEDKDEELIL